MSIQPSATPDETPAQRRLRRRDRADEIYRKTMEIADAMRAADYEYADMAYKRETGDES